MDTKLCILMLHNYYQNAGGEDLSMAAEIAMLQNAGHSVSLSEWHNDSIRHTSAVDKLNLFWQTTWNPRSRQLVQHQLKEIRADLLHVQNFFPLISPSVYSAARSLDVPVVQHLRNFRLGCLNAYLYRQNQVCEACIGRNPWRGVLYRCYRGSLPASLGIWQMLTIHRWRRTWHRDVDIFITPSQFAANKLIEIGLPPDKIRVKPNFVADPLTGSNISPLPEVPTFVFIGRLSPEKGVFELLRSWQQLNQPEWQLWIVGDGPMRFDLDQFCQDYHLKNVTFWGQQPAPKALKILQQSSMLVLPSHWYETFGRVVVESFACGRGVLVSDIGAPAELVTDGETGFQVAYTDESAWTERIRWCGDNLGAISEMGQRARKHYLANYTPEINYLSMMEIYENILN